MPEINLLAVGAAAASSFVLGGLWYSKTLFGVAWNREAGLGGKIAGERHPAKVFGIAIAAALVAAFLFAWYLGPNPELKRAIHMGVLVGAGFVATSFAVNYTFASRSLTMWLIDAGYHTLQFTLYGLILGLWH